MLWLEDIYRAKIKNVWGIMAINDSYLNYILVWIVATCLFYSNMMLVISPDLISSNLLKI